jgi:hypothetical protein
MHQLTQAGLEMVNALDEPIETLHQEAMKHMSRNKLKELIALLEDLRAGL